MKRLINFLPLLFLPFTLVSCKSGATVTFVQLKCIGFSDDAPGPWNVILGEEILSYEKHYDYFEVIKSLPTEIQPDIPSNTGYYCVRGYWKSIDDNGYPHKYHSMDDGIKVTKNMTLYFTVY